MSSLRIHALKVSSTDRPLDSPETDVFHTPPSTPSATAAMHHPSDTVAPATSTDNNPAIPSIRRAMSKPHSIAIDSTRPPYLQNIAVADQASNSPTPSPNPHAPGAHSALPIHPLQAVPPHSPLTGLTPRPADSGPSSSRLRTASNATASPALPSPCFVHSLLDKGASYNNWLETNGTPNSPDSGHGSSNTSSDMSSIASTDEPVGVARALNVAKGVSSAAGYFDDESDEGNSLTRQLAETAVGVRELSKQLGRARVHTNIQSVLIITKARDNRLIKLTRELAVYLMQKKSGDGQRGLTVYVDKQLRYSKRFDAEGMKTEYPEFFIPSPRRRSSSHSLPLATNLNKDSQSEEGQLRYWTSDMCQHNAHLFDFVVTLGGDGTVLFTSWLFQRIVPPVLPFALGSLGFLTNFDFADYAAVMDNAIDNGIHVNLRMRFTCTVYRAVAPEKGKGRKAVKKGDTGEIWMKNLEKDGWEALEGGTAGPGGPTSSSAKDREIMCFTTRPVETFEVLNDLVVDRGPSPYVSQLELFGDEHHMTTVQADGLTVSTPTGSTAYSLSAGGSLVHPEIPALLITPICPHTLSFRPMLLPDTMELRICVPYNSRSTAWASFDGRGRVELKQGDHIKVTASKYPFPTVCADKQSTDWFHAISRTLKWNERERQKSFVVVEEGPAKSKHKKTPSTGSTAPIEEGDEELDGNDEEDENEEEEEEEEDKFDIDDSSAEASATNSSGDVSPALPDKPAPRPLLDTDINGIETPDRFIGEHPHVRPSHPRHLISDAAERIRHLGSPKGNRPASATITAPPRHGENGDRDNIHAPDSAHQSSRSRIPLDRDVDAESMRTPRPEALINDRPSRSSQQQQQQQQSHQQLQQLQAQRRGPPSPQPRHHRRHGSVDSMSLPTGRRAFAAWGKDESDSNASDSDA